MTRPLCSADGCDRPTNYGRSTLCEMHYGRLRRNGHFGLQPIEAAPVLITSNGYRSAYAPKHPIATKGQQSRIYEHRKVYYEAHGDGPFNCHHCGAVVTWAGMHVDHLDDDPVNNDIDNLVASCPTCNQRRGSEKMAATKRAQGVRLTAFGRTMCFSEWAREARISRAGLQARLDRGWTLERAVTEPRGSHGPASRAA